MDQVVAVCGQCVPLPDENTCSLQQQRLQSGPGRIALSELAKHVHRRRQEGFFVISTGIVPGA